MIIQTACDCGQHVEVRTGDDSRDKGFRRDGKQAVYPGEEGYNIFRCKACGQPLHMTCEAFAYDAEANARFIVTAANYHERLVEALKEFLEVMERGFEYNISQANQRIRLSKEVSELLNELDTKKD